MCVTKLIIVISLVIAPKLYLKVLKRTTESPATRSVFFPIHAV